MNKEGYQPLKTKKTKKIIPPNTGSNIQMKKDGYTWEDLDKAWWEGFDNAKSKMEKRIAELEMTISKMEKGTCDICKETEKDKKIAELGKENAELKADNDARKFAMAMSENVEKQLREENADLKEEVNKIAFARGNLEEENAELKEQISTKDILIKELQEQKVYRKESSFDWRHKFFKKGSTKRLVQKDEQLTKAKELLKQFLEAKNGEDTYKAEWEAEQFLSEVEK